MQPVQPNVPERNMHIVFQPYETILSPTAMSGVSRIAMKKTGLPERGQTRSWT